MSSSIPEEALRRWSKPELDPLRQAILVFGSNARREAFIELFPDVSLLYQDGEGTILVKGVFYLTTSRFVFLPKNTIPHPQIVQAQFSSIKCISGARNGMSISIIDVAGSSVSFKFSNVKVLFQCFNLFRKIAEASRKGAAPFIAMINEEISNPSRDESPFSSIEVELAEVTKPIEIADAAPSDNQEDIESDPLYIILQPVKFFLDYCNHLQFDIHIKLRVLFFLSLISFLLQYIPFFPLVSLLVFCYLLFKVWKNISYKGEKKEAEKPKPNAKTEGYIRTQEFIDDWLNWKNPRKSLMLLQVTFGIFLGWAVLPSKVYIPLCITSFVVFIALPLFKSRIFSSLLSGFWFST